MVIRTAAWRQRVKLWAMESYRAARFSRPTRIVPCSRTCCAVISLVLSTPGRASITHTSIRRGKLKSTSFWFGSMLLTLFLSRHDPLAQCWCWRGADHQATYPYRLILLYDGSRGSILGRATLPHHNRCRPSWGSQDRMASCLSMRASWSGRSHDPDPGSRSLRVAMGTFCPCGLLRRDFNAAPLSPWVVSSGPFGKFLGLFGLRGRFAQS